MIGTRKERVGGGGGGGGRGRKRTKDGLFGKEMEVSEFMEVMDRRRPSEGGTVGVRCRV